MSHFGGGRDPLAFVQSGLALRQKKRSIVTAGTTGKNHRRASQPSSVAIDPENARHGQARIVQRLEQQKLVDATITYNLAVRRAPEQQLVPLFAAATPPACLEEPLLRDRKSVV